MAPARSRPTKDDKAVVNWEEQMAREADIAAAMEANSGGGQFFGLRGGVLTWQDTPVADNQMAVVIVDSIFENVYYAGKYDPDAPQAPSCFAFGRDEKTLAPHEIAVDKQHATCEGCPMNEWASADVGRGKACRNTRRLALLPAGTFKRDGSFEPITDLEHFETAGVGFMKLPVTSIKGYATFVKQLATTLRRPPAGIVTKIKVVPDAKTQFRILFEPLVTLPDDIIPTIFKRREEVSAIIDFPYQPNDEEREAPKASKKATTKRGGRY